MLDVHSLAYSLDVAHANHPSYPDKFDQHHPVTLGHGVVIKHLLKKIDDFQKSGTVAGNINSVDLSGTYFMISLMFNGVPGKIR